MSNGQRNMRRQPEQTRVSMAFVGQESAASSPAIAKLKGRARATNDPAYVPLASSHRAQSRRRRDLVAIFLDHRLSAVLLRADEVIESKSTRLTREHAHDIAPAVPALPSSRVVLRVVHGDDGFEIGRADLADAPLGGRRAREYEINPWGLK